MKISAQSNIGQIVAENYRFASVFKTVGIDFCCNGNRSIQEACDQKELNVEALLQKLNEAQQVGISSGEIDYKTWPLDLLADYIEKTHHRYVKQRIVEISPFLEKVVRVHGESHPELIEIGELFFGSAKDLSAHLVKEETQLFPFIRSLVSANAADERIEKPSFGSAAELIDTMHLEHDAEGERFRQIAALSNNYTPPEDACNTYRVTFSLLAEFEDDLHKHIHLENNILFPKAITLEKSLGA